MDTNAKTEDLPLWSWPFWSAGAVQKLASLAPQNLTQPILPGWSVGNVITVNERNSRAPDTERDIVAQESYGRQLGVIMDALVVLAQEHPDTAEGPLQELLALHARIEKIKAVTAEERVGRVRAELRKLENECPEAYRKLTAEFASGRRPDESG